MTLADKGTLLHAALDKDDVAEFAKLLKLYPECRYNGEDDGWLSYSAMDGRIGIFKYLVSQGADVKKPSNSTGSTPSPEGPLDDACGSGNSELVRYILDLGASINFVVDGETRCFPLTGAIVKGHLDIVKLLAERGAAIHNTWADKTPLNHAIEWGRNDIAEYLRSLGVKTFKEMG